MGDIVKMKTAHVETLTQYEGARSTHWVTPPDGLSVLEIQRTHKPWIFNDIPDDKNLVRPPYHYHWYQTEYFKIIQGRYIFTFEGVDSVKTAADGIVTIPATARHTFKVDPTYKTECHIEISTSPEGPGASESFFRNIYSYLEDCLIQKKEPSGPQLLLFLHEAEISLALPGPAWLMRWVGWGMGLVLGKIIGEKIMRLKSSYPEYYTPKKDI